MLLVMIVTLYTSRVILDALGASDYGIYSVVGGIVTMMTFLNGALSSSTSRFLTYELGIGNIDKLKKTFSASLNLHIVVALIVLLFGESMGLWLFYEKLVIPEERLLAAFVVYQFSIITTMVSFVQVPLIASVISHEKMSIYAYIGIYESFTQLFIVYLLKISPIDNLIFYAFLLMINKILLVLFYWIYVHKNYIECKFRLVNDTFLYKKLLRYSGWDIFGGIAVVCQGQGVNILLNIFFGPVVNAAMAIALQIQTAVSVFVSNILTAIRPQVIKSFADTNFERMYNLTFYAAKFSYLLMLSLVLPIFFEIDFILQIWLGENVPQSTSSFSKIVLITALMETFHTASLMAYHAIGKNKIGNLIGGSLMICALPFGYILLKFGYPPYSVFIAIFVVNFLQMFFGWYIIHRYVSYKYMCLIRNVYIPSILITVLSVIAPFLICSKLGPGWPRIVILTSITELILALLIFSIGLNKSERIQVFNLTTSKLKKI